MTTPMTAPPPPPPSYEPMTSTMPTMPLTRPTGVTILAVLDFIAAGLCVLGGLLLVALGGTIAKAIEDAAGTAGAFPAGMAGALGAVLGVFALVAAGLFLVMGLGFWKGWTWTWWVAGIFWVVGALSNVLSLGRNTGSALVSLALDLFLLWYITQKGVQRWFKVGMNFPWAK